MKHQAFPEGFEKENPFSLFTHCFWEWQEKARKKWRESSRGRRKWLGFGEYWDVQQHPAVSSTALPAHQAVLPPSQHLSCSHTSRRYFHLWAVQWTTSPPCWQPGAPQRGQTGLCKGEPDHRLALLGSTHHQAPSFISLHSVTFTVSKPSFQTIICPLISPHPPEVRWQIHPASDLPHTATSSDPPQSKAGVALLQPPAPGLLGDSKAQPATLSIPKLFSKTQGFLQHDYMNRVTAVVTLDVWESHYHEINHLAWKLRSGISWFSTETHPLSRWWTHS